MGRREFGRPDRPKLVVYLNDNNLVLDSWDRVIGKWKITKEWVMKRERFNKDDVTLNEVKITFNDNTERGYKIAKGKKTIEIDRTGINFL